MKSIYKLITLPIMILFASAGMADTPLPGKDKAETCLGRHAIEGYNKV